MKSAIRASERHADDVGLRCDAGCRCDDLFEHVLDVLRVQESERQRREFPSERTQRETVITDGRHACFCGCARIGNKPLSAECPAALVLPYPPQPSLSSPAK